VTPPLLELSGVSKDYHGLRPLRIEALQVGPRDQVAILGLDLAAAEMFAHLVTGAVLPDRGEVRLDGRPTAVLADSVEWLAHADRFGLVSQRAVLLETYSALQNLAVPFSLEIEPPAPDVQAQAEQLAREVALADADWHRPLLDVPPLVHFRVRLGRALALRPQILLLEHPSAEIPESERVVVAREVRALCERREIAAITLTADADLAAAIAARVLALDAASGQLRDRTRRSWFGRRHG
jgi:predicted ABC-type transport system involved in lysophospholipase L1 biosynthesis ATPase subunit